MLFSRILVVLFLIKTCNGVVPRIFGGKIVALKDKGTYITYTKFNIIDKYYICTLITLL